MDSPTKTKWPPGVGTLLAVVFWIVLWQITSISVHNSLIFPSPLTTIKNMLNLLEQSDFTINLCVTLLRVFGGVFLSIALGTVIGIFSGLNKKMDILIKPLVNIIRTLPVVSIIILINLWVASGIVPLLVTFLICFPIAYTNVVEGIHQTDYRLLEMAKVYGVPFRRILKDIYFPSIRPYFAAAVMNSMGMGWKATVTAEVLANAIPSVGIKLYYAKVYLETEELFAWTLIIVVMSFAIEKLTNFLLVNKREIVNNK